MKEQFVTYEIALKLKELGFDEECCAIYRKDRLYPILGFEKINSTKQSVITASLWQQVIDWLREKHNLCIEIQCPQRELSFYSWTIHKPLTIDSEEFSPTVYEDGFTNDYYKSREQAILKAIELC